SVAMADRCGRSSANDHDPPRAGLLRRLRGWLHRPIARRTVLDAPPTRLDARPPLLAHRPRRTACAAPSDVLTPLLAHRPRPSVVFRRWSTRARAASPTLCGRSCARRGRRSTGTTTPLSRRKRRCVLRKRTRMLRGAGGIPDGDDPRDTPADTPT